MGMSVAGDVADASFYAAAERPFILTPSVRRRFNVVAYARFKDDGAVILGGTRESRLHFWDEFRRHALHFVLKVERVSHSELQMLDLQFYKGPRHSVTGILDYKLYRKPTSIWRPPFTSQRSPLPYTC